MMQLAKLSALLCSQDNKMIDDVTLNRIAEYWRSQGVLCEKAQLKGRLAGTDLSVLWERVGMPAQDWWIFNFDPPVRPGSGEAEVPFGFAGEWKLFYSLLDDSCFELDLQGHKNFVNSKIGSFVEMLTIWDAAYRRIQRECSGDTGDDWDHGDAIVGEMREQMLQVDSHAFDSESFFWPTLIFEMAE
jgi:hypothetical protein